MIDLSLIALIYGLFLAYFVTLNISYMGLIALGVAANRRRSRERRATNLGRIESSDLTVPVSVIIPAYNEGAALMDTVHSALRMRFPEFEVIVVNDGSTDGTLERLLEAYDLAPRGREMQGRVPTQSVRAVFRSRLDPRLWVIDKENGGKADAANAGLNLMRYRYLLLTDADCIFARDALSRMIRPVNYDPARIVGLGATMRPLNGCDVRDGRVTDCELPPQWLVRFQLMEYASMFLATRLGWSALNAVPVLSGGISLWRKDTLRDMGGFTVTTTHEDLDTTIRIHQHFHAERQDYRIVYLPATVAWTEVPHTWLGIYRQRKRWQRAIFESVWRGRRMWFNPRYGTVGVILMPYLLLYEALGPIVELTSWVLTLALLALGIVDPLLLLAFLVTAAGLTAATRLAALVIDLVFYRDRTVGELLRLSATGFMEFWVYRPYLLVARVHALAEFLAGHRGHERAERQSARPTALTESNT